MLDARCWMLGIYPSTQHLASSIFFQEEQQVSVYDSKDLMSFNGAAREYGVPVSTLELAASQGALRVIEQDDMRWLLRPHVEQFVKRTVKRGAGNKVVVRINP